MVQQLLELELVLLLEWQLLLRLVQFLVQVLLVRLLLVLLVQLVQLVYFHWLVLERRQLLLFLV
jgi:hypothetical protein